MRSPKFALTCPLLLLLMGLATPPAWAGGVLTLIEDGPVATGPQITALSGDGSVAAGSDLFGRGFRYSHANGVTSLPGLPPLTADNVSVDDISATGAVVVGQARVDTHWEAFRNTAAGTVSLGLPSGATNSVAFATSSDGNTIYGGFEAFSWTPGTGLQPLAGFSFLSRAATSGDGTIVAGFDSGGAFRWTAAGGRVSLSPLPGDDGAGVEGLSEDGSTIVGSSANDTSETSVAVRWTDSEGIVSLGGLPGFPYSSATDTSADGSVIVGHSIREDPQAGFVEMGWVWTQATGMMALPDYLAANQIDASALSQPLVNGVSHDGTTFAGYDNAPNQLRSYVAEVMPSVPALGPLGLVALAFGLGSGAGILLLRRGA